MPSWYPELLASVAERVAVGHGRALVAVNLDLILTYWGIGRDILDRQSEEGWGAKVIDRLSLDLCDQFPGTRGYSPRNLKYMRATTLTEGLPDELAASLPSTEELEAELADPAAAAIATELGAR